MINLKINYSVEDEVNRIMFVVEKINWYKENGYKLWLPEYFSSENPDFKNPEYIKKTILKEYNEDDYKKQEKHIIDKLPIISAVLEKFFSEVSIKPLNEYGVNLTKYGTGGSYHSPDRLTINIKACPESALARNIIHEIIHLAIQEWIVKYEVNHGTKERIVDLAFEKVAPELNKIFRVPADAESIDKVFEENYPNIETVLEKLGK
ncbi:hypothetical protein KKC45_02565 [Patescibacteria group bacterium]|nr:hypothetical protein [Patescibacteria group bacterium]